MRVQPVKGGLCHAVIALRFCRVEQIPAVGIDVHHDAQQAVREGTFREDFFYRLNVFPIRVPAVRERPEDIPELVAQLIARKGGDPSRLSAEAFRAAADPNAFPEQIQKEGLRPWQAKKFYYTSGFGPQVHRPL